MVDDDLFGNAVPEVPKKKMKLNAQQISVMEYVLSRDGERSEDDAVAYLSQKHSTSQIRDAAYMLTMRDHLLRWNVDGKLEGTPEGWEWLRERNLNDLPRRKNG